MANALSLRYYGGAGPAWAALAADDKLLFQGALGALNYGAGGAIAVSAYNGGTHIISVANADVCLTNHQPNLKQGTTTQKVIVNASAEVDIDATHPAITECLNLHATCSPNAEVTAASMFVYGSSEAAAPANCTVRGLKQAQTGPWAPIGGSAAALDLGTGGSGATHDRYFGITITPTANGALTGTVKCSMTFV
jgi:hypothetical protein